MLEISTRRDLNLHQVKIKYPLLLLSALESQISAVLLALYFPRRQASLLALASMEAQQEPLPAEPAALREARRLLIPNGLAQKQMLEVAVFLNLAVPRKKRLP